MKKITQMRKSLIELTISTVSERGFDALSLRRIAQSAGGSTALIFQNFSGKTDLIEAAVSHAVERDMTAHQEALTSIGHLVSNHLSLSDYLSAYVELRTGSPYARFLTETFVKLNQFTECRETLRLWHAQRIAFWQSILSRFPVSENLADVVAGYALMEELYAYSLISQPTYRLQLRETSRALTASSFHDGQHGALQTSISEALAVKPLSVAEQSSEPVPAMRRQLLDHAVKLISQHGVGALNQRDLGKQAGVAPSMIAYHFKDMKSFTHEAIWRAMMNGIPSELDPENSTVVFPTTMSQWLALLNRLTQPATEDAPAGYYVGAARITGAASLLVRSQPTLLPLIAYLRGLEGWGTYRVSRNIGSQAERIGRDHAAAFGVWIKSEALLRGAGLVNCGADNRRLIKAANTIFPHG